MECRCLLSPIPHLCQLTGWSFQCEWWWEMPQDLLYRRRWQSKRKATRHPSSFELPASYREPLLLRNRKGAVRKLVAESLSLNSFLKPVQITAGVKLNSLESVIERNTIRTIKIIGQSRRVGHSFISNINASISIYLLSICKLFVNSEEKQPISALKAFLPLCGFS